MRIFRGVLSGPHNIVMDLNNVMMLFKHIVELVMRQVSYWIWIAPHHMSVILTGTIDVIIMKLNYPRWLLNTFPQTTSTLTPMLPSSTTWPRQLALATPIYTHVSVCVKVVHHKNNKGEREGCVTRFIEKWRKYRWNEIRQGIELQWDEYIWRVVNCKGDLTP